MRNRNSGSDEHPLEHRADARVEVRPSPRRLEEAVQVVHVGRGHRPAVGAPGEGRDDLAGAGLLGLTVGGTADEELPPARHVVGGLAVERAADHDVPHRRLAAHLLVGAVAERRHVDRRLQDALLKGWVVHERDGHRPQPRLDRHPHLEVVVGVVGVPLPLGPAHARAAAEARDAALGVGAQPAAGDERGDQRAVHPHVELVGDVADAADVVVEVAAQPDPDGVLAVEGEVVVHRHAPAGAERQVVAGVVVLNLAVGHAVGVEARPQGGVADRELADLPGRVEVALHEGRRHREHVGDVVEALVVVVGREQRLGVDLEAEKVADGVAVLDPVEPMRDGAAGVRVGGGGAVELVLEPRRHRVVGGLVGARPADGGHHARPQLQRHRLPGGGVRAHVRGVERLQRHGNAPRRVAAVAVAGDAVAVQHRLDRGRGRRRGGRLGRASRRRGLGLPRHRNRGLQHEAPGKHRTDLPPVRP